MVRKSSEQALTFAPMKVVGHSIAEDEEAEVLEEGNMAFSVTGSSGFLRELGGQLVVSRCHATSSLHRLQAQVWKKQTQRLHSIAVALWITSLLLLFCTLTHTHTTITAHAVPASRLYTQNELCVD